MQNKRSYFLDRNYDVQEVKLGLKFVKNLNYTKQKFLKQLSFDAEPADFEKALSAYNLDKEK